MTETWALVPLKHLARAKARLSPVLNEADRRELALCMAKDVVAALSEVDAVAHTLLVSNEPEAGRLLKSGKLDVFYSAEHETLNTELTQAAAYAAAQGADQILIVHADLPYLNPQAIERFLDTGPRTRLRAAGCKLGTGTNLLLAPLPLDIPLVFGTDSLSGFIKLARTSEKELEVISDPVLGMDIDGPEDFKTLISSLQSESVPGPATRMLLQRVVEQRLEREREREREQPNRAGSAG